MPLYHTVIKPVGIVKTYLQSLQGAGEVMIDADGNLSYIYEAEDLYEVAIGLKDTIHEADANAGTFEASEWEKPEEVQNWGPVIMPKDVEIPAGMTMSTHTIGGEKPGAFIPAETVAHVLKAHGIKVVEL